MQEQTNVFELRETLQKSKNALERYLELWNGESFFIVIVEGGIPIRCEDAKATFHKVIKTLAAENMDNLRKSNIDSPLITNEYEDNREEIALGRYIKKRMNNVDKAKYLLLIAERFDIELYIIDIMNPDSSNNEIIAAWRTRRHGKYINDAPWNPEQVNPQ